MRAHALLGALCFALIASCSQGEQQAPVKDDPLDKQPSHISYNVHVTFLDSASKKAVLQSAVARVWEEKQETTMGDTVIVDFYSQTSQKRLARLTSDSALVDDRTKNMTAIGHVYVWSDSSRTSLATTRLNWDSQRAILYSTEYVKIISPSETIEGQGFESDQYLTNYRIFRVRGVHR
ncbi:hypothetical protein BH10BAC6_BH10BAC6_08610 [soil metagenome]